VALTHSSPLSLPANKIAARPARRRQLISLTPLIDVVFILLVFFMLASSFLDWRAIDLDAPAPATGSSSLEGALLVEVTDQGIRLAGEMLTLDSLQEKLSKRIAEKPNQRVLVRPAEGVPLQPVVQVIDRLVAAGAHNLSVIRRRGS